MSTNEREQTVPQAEASAARAGDARGAEELLRVRGLFKHFPVKDGDEVVRAVDGVTFEIFRGETLGLVGESGCGKSTVGRCLLRLIEPTRGEINFDGRDVRALGGDELRRLRREMQIIFQDPYASLNPRLRVRDIVSEPLVIHDIGDKTERRERVADLLRKVGLDPDYMNRYPHEFSGGQRQRIGIARALALNPKLIVADEPVSALDVSVQAQVLNLLADLQRERGLAYLFVSHDLGVVEYIADSVAVMYLGVIVERAPKRQFFAGARHPYATALLGSVPSLDPRQRRRHVLLEGDVPSAAALPGGCRFRTRCPLAHARCAVEEPHLREIEPEHFVACHAIATNEEETSHA
jgi:oligopeptide transport system ATP-binding protein